MGLETLIRDFVKDEPYADLKIKLAVGALLLGLLRTDAEEKKQGAGILYRLDLRLPCRNAFGDGCRLCGGDWVCGGILRRGQLSACIDDACFGSVRQRKHLNFRVGMRYQLYDVGQLQPV